MFHPIRAGWHQHAHVFFGDFIACIAFDQNLVNLAVVQVADGAFDQVAFFIDGGGCDGFQGQVTDLFPLAQKIFVVAFDFGFGAFGTRGTNDKTRAFWHFDFASNFFELFAIWRVGDFAGNAATTRRVWHKNTVPTRKRQVGCECCAFVAALFFHDLNQKDLAYFDDFLDFIATGTGFARAEFSAGMFVVVVVVVWLTFVVVVGDFADGFSFYGCFAGCFICVRRRVFFWCVFFKVFPNRFRFDHFWCSGGFFYVIWCFDNLCFWHINKAVVVAVVCVICIHVDDIGCDHIIRVCRCFGFTTARTARFA